MKLIVEEPESAALASFLASRRERVSSSVLLTEVPLAVRRSKTAPGEARDHRLAAAMASLTLVSLRPPLLRLAGAVEPASTRALDAIHVATALRLSRRVKLFVSYDERQLTAARRVGLTTASPGAET